MMGWCVVVVVVVVVVCGGWVVYICVNVIMIHYGYSFRCVVLISCFAPTVPGWNVGGGGGGKVRGSNMTEFNYATTFEFAASRAVTSMPCALRLHSDTNLHKLTALIAQGRRILTNMRQSYLFATACYTTLFFLYFLSTLVDSPPLFAPFQVLWLVWVIIPLISLSLMFTHRDPFLMQRVAPKTEKILVDRYRFLSYFFLRFGPSICVYLCIYLWLLHSASPSSATVWNSYYWSGSNVLAGTVEFESLMLQTQSYALCVFVYFLAVLSMSFVNRTLSVFKFSPFVHNKVWIVMAVACFALQVVFCVITVLRSDVPLSIRSFDGYTFLAAAFWPVVIVIVDELVKSDDAVKFRRFNKAARLFFDTKLGMHSPK